MCGIAGIVYLKTERKVSQSVLKQMTDAIQHRGPDDEGFYCNENVGLGFRRLSIIDLNTGHQPLLNEDENISIIFNGEIYNYQEQRELLKKKGYRFRTATDTEVILHLYEEYGADCVKHLRGMFAFAIWDNNKKQLFCARDRFGIKPFYYYIDNEKFVFASEIKAIVKVAGVNKDISTAAIDSYFAYGYITGSSSIYNNIKKIQPAHTLLLSYNNNFRINTVSYWSMNFEPDYVKTEKQWMEEIEECLFDAVKLHMISDVPIGAFLSGGIDSSSVVAMMARHSSKPIKTFSIGFKEKKFNELQYAREIAEKYNCEYHERIVEPESINLLPKLVAAYDEPFADSSAIPTYYVSKFAKEHAVVVLSGDGGDELFAGYNSYPYFNKISKYGFSYPGLNKLVWGNLNKLIPVGGKAKNLTYFLSGNRKYAGAQSVFWTKADRKKLLSDDMYHNKIDSELIKEAHLVNSKYDLITSLQKMDMQTYMVDDILTKLDRASMMNSIEARVPLLDHKFAELSFKIPWQLKLKGDNQKYILKKAMAKYLPDSILSHPKQGFAVPLSVWFKNDLKDYINDTLLSSNAQYSTYLDKKYVHKIINNNRTTSRDLSVQIWSLLFFEEWVKQNK
jgi:asparagine synthase (glutamine-hydrolysing)